MRDFVDKLVIDRQKVKDEFARYTGNYDVDNDKIRLKIEHTYINYLVSFIIHHSTIKYI